jgi:hypothetical protein
MIIDGNVDYKGVLVGSSASISSMNAIQGITANGSSIGIGIGGVTIVFSNSNNITFGMSGSTVTASAGTTFPTPVITVNNYPPLGFYGLASTGANVGTTAGTGGSTQTTASGTIHPMVLPYAISFNEVHGLVSQQTASSNGVGSLTEGWLYGIYTLNASTAFSLISSYAFIHLCSQSSTSALSNQFYWGTDSAANSTGLSGNVSASLTGLRRLLLSAGNNSYAASQYYLGAIFTRRSSSALIGQFNSLMCYSASATALANYYGQAALNPFQRYLGFFSTTSNGTSMAIMNMPGSIATSVLTASVAGGDASPFIGFRVS